MQLKDLPPQALAAALRAGVKKPAPVLTPILGKSLAAQQAAADAALVRATSWNPPPEQEARDG